MGNSGHPGLSGKKKSISHGTGKPGNNWKSMLGTRHPETMAKQLQNHLI